jgi:hypothetical protein
MSVSKKNSEGYMDLTYYGAITSIERERNRERRAKKRQGNKSGKRPPPREYYPLVYVCSPYSGDVEHNVGNARKYAAFSVEQGAMPIAPHLHYPQFLNDDDPKQRKLGLTFGIIWLAKCSQLWVFGNVISEGMKTEIAAAKKRNITVRYFTANMEEIL